MTLTVLFVSALSAHGIEKKSPANDDAELVVLVGDIDNLGFGWPQEFDVFSGSSTPTHSFPWKPDADDPPGTDRIMLGTSFDGHPPAGQDGYASTTSRPDNQPLTIIMQFDPGETRVKSAILQMFVDDFQSPVWKGNFQVEINELRAPFLEEVLNSLVQTGPIGKLITVQIPDEFLDEVSSGMLTIRINDPTTGAGDGYAVDFVRLLINPKNMMNTGTVSGEVLDQETGEPVNGARASASGLTESRTDGDGRFVLEDVPAGLVAVTVSKSGYASLTRTIDLTSGGDAQLDFQLQKEEKSEGASSQGASSKEVSGRESGSESGSVSIEISSQGASDEGSGSGRGEVSEGGSSKGGSKGASRGASEGKDQKEESEIMNTWNIGYVENSPSCNPSFTIDEPLRLTYVDTYHWNYGKGAQPGTISLHKDDGTLYGPWEVEGNPGQGGVQNAYWIARPNEVLPAGTYRVEDSDQATWAQNSESGGCGFSKVKGIYETDADEGQGSSIRTVGPEGGSIDLGEGIRVVFPAGALDKDVEVSASKIDPSEYLIDDLFDGIVLEIDVPAGRLKKSAEIHVPLPSYITQDSGSAFAGSIDEDGAMIVENFTIEADEGEPELVLSTNHFSKFFFMWLFEDLPPLPSESGPLMIPYYEQGTSKYCWAASALMISQAANYKKDAQVFHIVGSMGIDGPDMSWSYLPKSKLREVIYKQCGIMPARIRWGMFNSARDYIRRVIVNRHCPVMILSGNKKHAWVIVGYSGDKFYVHDSMEPDTNPKKQPYNLESWDKPWTAEAFWTVEIPKDVRQSENPITVNIKNNDVKFYPTAGANLEFKWDYHRPEGYSLSILKTIGNREGQVLEEFSSGGSPGGVPSDLGYVEIGDGASEGISIANSDLSIDHTVTVCIEIFEKGKPTSSSKFRKCQTVEVPRKSFKHVSFESIQKSDFYVIGVNDYTFRVSASENGADVAEASFDFRLIGLEIVVTSPEGNKMAKGETGKDGTEYTFSASKSTVPDDAEYEWCFDDDCTKGGSTITHSFASSGMHQIKATANWKGGSAKAETVFSTTSDQQPAGKGEVAFMVFRWTRRLGIDPDTDKQYKKERQYCQDFAVDGRAIIASNGMYSVDMPAGQHRYTVNYKYTSPLADSGTISGTVNVVADRMNPVEVETPPAEYNA